MDNCSNIAIIILITSYYIDIYIYIIILLDIKLQYISTLYSSDKVDDRLRSNSIYTKVLIITCFYQKT